MHTYVRMCRPVEEDKVICPEFDGLWSGPVASTGAPRHHVTPGGEDPDVEKEHKYTMSKMEQVHTHSRA